ncbi:MAG TPA: metal-dependent hydrolase [Pseudobdellovibrionaceae bacterium]|nr:metal-dependent hydrolase [Pseudobdellovibrionaceae bacterium]
MDPISQFTLGACAALALKPALKHVSPEIHSPAQDLSIQRWLVVIGGLSGAAPDLDVLIRSSQDPLLSLEFHRHFTHALVFIPLGGVLIAAMLWLLFHRKLANLGLNFRAISLMSCVGWATHGPLDACTSYGTQLFWPLSSERIAWNLVGVIDPLPTLCWLVAVSVAVSSRRFNAITWARVGLAISFSYLAIAGWQQERATSLQARLIENRHGEASSAALGTGPRASVKPTLLQILLWKSIYEINGRIYTDALWMGVGPKIYPGQCVEKYEILAPKNSILESDLKRFAWFSDAWLGVVADRSRPPEVIAVGDVRYSMLPHQIEPLWGIEFNLNQAEQHVQTWSSRRRDGHTLREYFRMIRGEEKLADATRVRHVAELSDSAFEIECPQRSSDSAKPQ